MSTTSKLAKAGKRIPQYPGREAWEAIVAPYAEPVAKRLAGRSVQRLMGFWVLWHAYGNDRAKFIAAGVLSQRGIYGQQAEFREVFGVDVSEFLPEIAAMIRAAEQR